MWLKEETATPTPGQSCFATRNGLKSTQMNMRDLYTFGQFYSPSTLPGDNTFFLYLNGVHVCVGTLKFVFTICGSVSSIVVEKFSIWQASGLNANVWRALWVLLRFIFLWIHTLSSIIVWLRLTYLPPSHLFDTGWMDAWMNGSVDCLIVLVCVCTCAIVFKLKNLYGKNNDCLCGLLTAE